MVYKLAEWLIPRTNGRSCTSSYIASILLSHSHFCMRGNLQSAVRVFQQALTVESNS